VAMVSKLVKVIAHGVVVAVVEEGVAKELINVVVIIKVYRYV
jgi:hypothetical protein